LFADPADLGGKSLAFQAQDVCAWFPGGSAPLFCVSAFAAPRDLDTWARITTSDSYQLFSLTQVLGTICLLFGLFTLYGCLLHGRSPRWALTALIFSIVGIVPALMMLGERLWAEPILATFYQNGINVCPTSLADPGYIRRWGVSGPQALCEWSSAPMSFPMALTTIFLLWGGGALTLAVAIWRSSLVSKWLAVPFGLAYYMCVSSDPLVTLIGGFLMLVVGGWIALRIGREGATRSARRAPLATPPAAPSS
jgi:hypothetical protein